MISQTNAETCIPLSAHTIYDSYKWPPARLPSYSYPSFGACRAPACNMVAMSFCENSIIRRTFTTQIDAMVGDALIKRSRAVQV